MMNKTITIEDLSNLGEEKYLWAKAMAHNEYNKLMRNFSTNIWISDKVNNPLSNKTLRAQEVAFCTGKYSQEDYVTKCIIASNLAFINDESFINILIDNGYTIGNLVLLSRYFEKITVLDNTPQELDLKDVKIISKEIKHIERICKLMKKFFAIEDYYLIANKITEIVVFQRDLYLERTQKSKESKIKV